MSNGSGKPSQGASEICACFFSAESGGVQRRLAVTLRASEARSIAGHRSEW
jgi:hypothetical protein